MWSIKTFFGLNRLVRLDVGMKVATIEATVMGNNSGVHYDKKRIDQSEH